MQASLKVKISGSRNEVEQVITTLEKEWICRVASQSINSSSDMGIHIFIALIPKTEE